MSDYTEESPDGFRLGLKEEWLAGTEEFTKFDTEKNRLELLEPEFILGVGRIITYGAKKYSAHNWKKAKPEDVERIKGALLRHMLAYLNGELIDDETCESHLYHASCCAMFLDYFDRKK